MRWPTNHHHGSHGHGAGLQASLHLEADRTSVSVSGEIDRYSGPMLGDLLNAALNGSVPQVEVDMAQVGFIDIAGLRVLSRAHHVGAQRGVALTLRRLSPHLIWLLQITGSTTLLAGEQARVTSTPHPSQ